MHANVLKALVVATFIVLPSRATAARVATVSYVTGSTVYIDAGTNDGIAAGDSLQVWRDGKQLGTLAVDYTTASRATCALGDSDFTPQTGDEIHIDTSRPLKSTPVVEDSPTEPPTPPRWRGRIGLSVLGARTRRDWGQDYDQPAADFRLSGSNLADGRLSVDLDARARQTFNRPVAGSTTTESRSRLYRANLAWSPQGSRSSVVVGRQSSRELSNLSVFDGVSATFRSTQTHAGVTGGSQPDGANYGWSPDTMEIGTFIGRHSLRESAVHWNLTLAGIGSYRQGEIDREYLYLEGSWSSARAMLFASQEVDFHRGWKAEVENHSIAPTATYALARYRLRREFALRAGFDSRRRVRRWIDRETPETRFDESFRQGYWIGVDSRPGRAWSFGLDLRASNGGSNGNANVASLRARWNDHRRLPVLVGTRLSYFRNDRSNGQLSALDLGWEVTRRLNFDLETGLRTETMDSTVQEDLNQKWLRLDAEVSLQQGWYLRVGGERWSGGIDASSLYNASVDYRF